MIKIVTTINTNVELLTLNISLSSSKAFGLTFGPAKLIAIMIAIVKKKDSPIQMWNGISNPPFPLG